MILLPYSQEDCSPGGKCGVDGPADMRRENVPRTKAKADCMNKMSKLCSFGLA